MKIRLFSDHDVYGQTIRHLVMNGYEVVRAQDVGLARAKDEALLAYAFKNEFVLITRDKDFGRLVFLYGRPSPGVIFLRISPITITAVHHQLVSLLKTSPAEQLKRSFVTIEATHFRIRMIQ